jgi:hypothetical protein
VVGRAKEILATLEGGDSASLPSSEYPSAETGQLDDVEECETPADKTESPKKSEKKVKSDPSQLELF